MGECAIFTVNCQLSTANCSLATANYLLFTVNCQQKMAKQNKPSIRRGEMAFLFAIVLGLLLGLAIKRVRIGILLGLIIGGAIVFLGWTRANNNRR